MNEDQEKYRQLALFSLIVAEIALVPLALGGLVYYFTRQQGWAMLGGAVGLVLGGYRVFLLLRKINKSQDQGGPPDGT